MTEFGHWLIEKRDLRGLTSYDLISKCGMEKSLLSHYKNGHTLPSVISLIKIREGLGLTDAELIQMFDAITADLAEQGKLDDVLGVKEDG